MRYVTCLVAFLLACPAYADILLTEVTKEFNIGPCCRVAPEYISWVPRSAEPYGLGWNADEASTGVPQRKEIPVEMPLNDYYHFYDFSVSNELSIVHTFSWGDGRGLLMRKGLDATSLFVTGSYGFDPLDTPFHVVSHYTRPMETASSERRCDLRRSS